MSSPSSSSPTLPEIANVTSPEARVVVSGRFAEDDVPKLDAAGIRHVIDLTTPAETPGFYERRALDTAGIAYHRLPIGGADDLTLAQVRDFDRLVRSAGRPRTSPSREIRR